MKLTASFAHLLISGVYRIIHTKSGKCYVGSSNQIRKRWQTHARRLLTGRHENSYLQAAYNKYGADAFEIVMIEECSLEYLRNREQHYIEFYRSYERACGYNLSRKARMSTAEAREKMSGTRSGRKFSAEHRRHMSEARRGQKMSPEAIEKLRQSKMGKKLGPRSTELRDRISIGRRGKGTVDKTKYCLHCKRPFEYKHRKQRYCSYECSVAAIHATYPPRVEFETVLRDGNIHRAAMHYGCTRKRIKSIAKFYGIPTPTARYYPTV